MREAQPGLVQLHPSAERVLEAIRDNPGTTGIEVAKQVCVTEGTVSHHVNNLLRLGLVVQERDAKDRRLYRLRAI